MLRHCNWYDTRQIPTHRKHSDLLFQQESVLVIEVVSLILHDGRQFSAVTDVTQHERDPSQMGVKETAKYMDTIIQTRQTLGSRENKSLFMYNGTLYITHYFAEGCWPFSAFYRW